MINISYIDLLGWLGSILLLLGYTLNIFKKINSNSYNFLILNFVGSTCLVVNAFVYKVYPFFVINLFWVIASIIQIINNKRYHAGRDL